LQPFVEHFDIPADLDIPDSVEVVAYYVASEALTNATKHADAASIDIRVTMHERDLRLTVHDDGVGGAVVGAGSGSGLIGLTDRVHAVGGRIDIVSPHRGGTTLDVTLPVARVASVNSS
jgi:signal transduction histidine kinase